MCICTAYTSFQNCQLSIVNMGFVGPCSKWFGMTNKRYSTKTLIAHPSCFDVVKERWVLLPNWGRGCGRPKWLHDVHVAARRSWDGECSLAGDFLIAGFICRFIDIQGHYANPQRSLLAYSAEVLFLIPHKFPDICATCSLATTNALPFTTILI